MKRLDLLIALLRDIYALLQQFSTHYLSPDSQKPEPEEYLEPYEVQKRLGISERTFYRHLKEGILVPRRIGKRIFFYPSDLIRAMEESKRKGRI